jgi:hypothetical protein
VEAILKEFRVGNRIPEGGIDALEGENGYYAFKYSWRGITGIGCGFVLGEVEEDHL